MSPSETPNTSPNANQPPSVADIGDSYKVRNLSADSLRRAQATTGRRTRATDTPHGHTVRAITPTKPITSMSDIALIPSIQAQALRQTQATESPSSLILHPSSLRRKVRTARTPNLILFVVDASGSMAARQRMVAVKGAIMSLLIDAYQKRDSVGLITFRSTEATLLLPPTNSVTLAQKQLATLPTGGRTPLTQGLQLAHKTIKQQLARQTGFTPLLVLLSDGRGNVSQLGNPVEEATKMAQTIGLSGTSSLVIDCESGYPKLGLAQKVGNAMRAETVKLESLSADSLTTAIRQQIQRQIA